MNPNGLDPTRDSGPFVMNGGPLDGRELRTTSDLIKVAGHPDMAYHRRRNEDGSRYYEWAEDRLGEPE
jgi:hypothetical protein